MEAVNTPTFFDSTLDMVWVVYEIRAGLSPVTLLTIIETGIWRFSDLGRPWSLGFCFGQLRGLSHHWVLLSGVFLISPMVHLESHS